MESIVQKNKLVPRLSLNKYLMRQGSVISQEEEKIISVKWLTVCTSLMASLGYVAIGTFVAWSSKLSADIGGEVFRSIGIKEISWLSSALALVAAVITILVYKLYFAIGTKKLLVFAAILMITSLIVMFSCDVNFLNVLGSRALAGCGVGIVYLLVPVYLQELATPEYRQMTENILNVAFAVGILFQYITDYFGLTPLRYIMPFVFPVCFLGGFAFLPESPKYLFLNHRILAARQIMERYRESIDDIDWEFDRWTASVEAKEPRTEQFHSIDNAKVMVPIIGLVFFQQIIGVTSLFFYMDKIFMLTNTHAISIRPSIVIAAIFVMALPLYGVLSINIKHRTSLLWTVAGMTVILVALGWVCHVQNIRGMTSFAAAEPSYQPLIWYGVVILLYTVGLYRLTSRYIQVLAPDHLYFGVKTITSALTWTIVFGLVKCLPELMYNIGVGWIYWTMFVMLTLAWLFVYYFVPDLPKSSGEMLSSCASSERGEEAIPSPSLEDENEIVIV